MIGRGLSRFHVGGLVILGSLSTPQLTFGASFDCARAASPQETAICGDKALGGLDSEMATIYEFALTKLSKEGANTVENGQREWLAFARRSCPLTTDHGKHALQVPAWCLAQIYQDRLTQLKTSAVQVGPFLFSRVDRFRTARGNDPICGPRLATEKMSYPRIDQPANAMTATLNGILRPRSVTPDTDCGVHADGTGDGNYQSNFELTFASEKLISITWRYWSSCFCGAHGDGGSFAQNLVLNPKPRKLMAKDLFKDGSGWQERLKQLSVGAVEFQLDKRYISATKPILPTNTVTSIGLVVTNPDTWTLRTKGLEVTFEPDSLGMGRTVESTILIPWTKLRLVMRPDAPIW